MRASWRAVGLLVAGALTGAFAAPAAADDTVVVDFEAGPPLETPITTEYQTSSFVFFQRSDAMRPYRRSAPGKARSGSVVANAGADRCVPEGGTGSDCEFPVGGTVGRLTRTARSVVVHAGLFEPAGGAVTVQLRALRADGTVAATGSAVPVGTAGFTTEVSVTSAAADIARFDVLVGGPGAVGAAVGFDDLTLVYPAGSLPDVALSATRDTVVVQQGGTVDVPVTVTRINGSDGDLDLSAAGLPLGVTAELIPDPVPGTSGAATVRLTAAADAPRSHLDVPQDVTITGDPHGDNAVAPAPREVAFPLRVASPYELRARGTTTPAVPTCASTDVPLRLERDRAFGGTVTLRATGLPAGVSAAFTPGPVIEPGGGFYVDVTLRLTGPVSPVAPARIVVEASSPGVTTRTLALDLRAATPEASVRTPSSGRLTAPQFGRAGTEVRLEGNGFCPGTRVRVGTSAGETAASVEGGGRELVFATPRLATPGPLTVVPPAGAPYAAGTVDVATYRSTAGLSFGNYPFTGLSLREAADVFGLDELFMKVNPCWPFGSCPVITPIPDPTAFVAYAIIDEAMQSTGGHCFGISRAVQGWTANPATLNPFTSGPWPFAIPGRSGALDSHLDGQHALQASAEFIRAYFLRDQTIEGNLAVIRSQLAAGRAPLVSMAFDGGGHAVLAYDVVDRPDGGVDVLLYDNNVPFLASERTNAETHIARETQRSVLRISPDRRRWEFDNGEPWSGGGDTLFASAFNVIPLDPSLPGGYQLAEGLAYLIFGSADGSVRTDGRAPGSDLLPPQDSTAQRGASGVIGARAGAPLSHTVKGVRTGRYTQAVVSDGSIASVEVATAPGVRDTTAPAPGGDGVRFAALGGAPARRLRLQVATKPSAGSSRTASVTTTTAGGGHDTLQLTGGTTMRYAHTGPPASVRFTLRAVQADGGPATFASGPVRVRPGDRLAVRPGSWRALDRVRAVVRSRGGRTRTLRLRNRAAAPARLTLSAPRLRGRAVTVGVRFGRLPRVAAAGVVLRAVRGGRTVARRAVGLSRPKRGSRTLRWVLPASLPRGSYRIVANATLSVAGARTGTVRRQRSARARVR